MIQPIDIVNYLYCPRYIYYQYVLKVPQFEEKNYLVLKGREIHELKKVRNKDYLRKKIGVVKKEIQPYLSNGLLRGIPDEVVWLDDGTMAALEYKFSEYKNYIYEPVKQQLIAYSILIEDFYNAKVNRGFIVFIRSKNHLEEIKITEKDKENIRNTVREIYEIINNEIYPDVKINTNKCRNCTYRNICVL